MYRPVAVKRLIAKLNPGVKGKAHKQNYQSTTVFPFLGIAGYYSFPATNQYEYFQTCKKIAKSFGLVFPKMES